MHTAPRQRLLPYVLLALALIGYASYALAATPLDAVVNYTPGVVDATHSAAASCALDRGVATPLGTVTPGQAVTAAAPDYGTYTFGIVCSNSAGAATRVTFTATIAPKTLSPNPPTSFTLTFACSIASGSSVATCVQT